MVGDEADQTRVQLPEVQHMLPKRDVWVRVRKFSELDVDFCDLMI